MAATEERYISLLTDFGFKRIFGTAPNKDLLINFLNSLFDGRKVIKDLKYNNSEHVGDIYTERKAIFDVYCESIDGEKFIVEMQNASQKYLKDRTIFYSTYPIREQAPKGDAWDYRLSPVYTVALVNHDMKEESFDEQEISHQVQLCDTTTKRVFYDKLEFIYVEVIKFNKTEDELVTLYDKWLYALKNLANLTARPTALRDKIFDRLFQVAEIAKFTPTELREYEDSLKHYRDLKNSLDTAEEKGILKGIDIGRAEGLVEGRAQGLVEGRAEGLVEGRAEGLVEGRAEGLVEGRAEGIDIGLAQGRAEGINEGLSKGIMLTAKNLKTMGLSVADIIKATGLKEEEIAKL